MTTEARPEAAATTAAKRLPEMSPTMTAAQKSLSRGVILHLASTEDVVTMPAGMMKRMPVAPRT